MVGRNKTTIFVYVKDRIQSKLHSWNKNFLSRAGQEVLLKTVAQAIPIYVMSIFLLPKSMCLEIERLMNAYWWRKVPGTLWENLSTNKKLGGMGFRRLEAFNKALIAKQTWRIMTNPESLVASIHKARYIQ